MTHFHVTFDLSHLAGAIDEAGAQAYRVINRAVRQTAAEVTVAWRHRVHSALPVRDAWTMARSEAAVSSITCVDVGPFESRVQSSNLDVYQLENGTPARDLKAMLQTSSRTKVSKSGNRYLTIPMRHGTPGSGALAPAMPKRIYDIAKQMGQSEVIGVKQRPNALGGMVPQNVYRWDKKGAEFERGKKKYLSLGPLPAGLVPKLKPEHKTDILAGLRRTKADSGGSKSSVWLTFRVMSDKSPPSSWVIPAKLGQHIARDIATQTQRGFGDRITAALRAVGV